VLEMRFVAELEKTQILDAVSALSSKYVIIPYTFKCNEIRKTIVSPPVWYGGEKWSLTFKG
jgi:hypothetical protein